MILYELMEKDQFGLPTEESLKEQYNKEIKSLQEDLQKAIEKNKQKRAAFEQTLATHNELLEKINSSPEWKKIINNIKQNKIISYFVVKLKGVTFGWLSGGFVIKKQNNYNRIASTFAKNNWKWKSDTNLKDLFTIKESNELLSIVIDNLPIIQEESLKQQQKPDTEKLKTELAQFIGQEAIKKVSLIYDLSNPGYWAWGDFFVLFVYNNKLYQFEFYDSGAYSGHHVHKIRCFREVNNELEDHNNPVIRKLTDEEIHQLFPKMKIHYQRGERLIKEIEED